MLCSRDLNVLRAQRTQVFTHKSMKSENRSRGIFWPITDSPFQVLDSLGLYMTDDQYRILSAR